MREWVVEVCISAYRFLLPVSWIALALVIVVLLPLAAWRKTRGWAAVGLVVASFIFGITTWLLGAAATFASFGWFGLIVGLLIVGVGVVPLGVLGAFWKLKIAGLAWSLLVMLAITMLARAGGLYVAQKG